MLATTIITPAVMYWITRLNGINNVLGFIVCGCAGTCIVLTVGLFTSLSEQHYKVVAFCAKWLKKMSMALAIAVACFVFTPTLKEMCAILVVPAIANNEKVQGLGEEFYDLAKEWMQELKPKKGETK